MIMKTFPFIVFALSLADQFKESFQQPDGPISLGRFELISIGQGYDRDLDYGIYIPPTGNTTSSIPLVGEVYFEAREELWDRDPNVFFLEMYTFTPEGTKCDHGNNITDFSVVTLTSSVVPYDNITADWPAPGTIDETPDEIDSNFTEADDVLQDDYTDENFGDPMEESVSTSRSTSIPALTFPQATNGRVGRGMFRIEPTPFALGGDQQIFFPNEDQSEYNGKLKFCVRVAVKLDYMNNDGIPDTISYHDTMFSINVRLIGEFSTLNSAEVSDPSGPDLVDSDKTIEKDVVSYLCDATNEAVDVRYAMGEDFRICVAPIDESDMDGATYSVSKFINIYCSNIAVDRLVIDNGVPDSFTKADAVPDEIGVLGFASRVTDDYFKENENSFICKGQVELLDSSNDDIESTSRSLKEFKIADFETVVQIDAEPSRNGSSSGSSAISWGLLSGISSAFLVVSLFL